MERYQLIRIPRDAPGNISIAPFLQSAFKCSSAALGERKPSLAAISARVGGKPVSSIKIANSIQYSRIVFVLI